MKNVIEVKNLSKTFSHIQKKPGIGNSLRNLFAAEKRETHAVKDVSFSIREGELVGFLGPNGAGKTTTLKMLSGILTPTNGELSVLGFEPIKRQKDYQMQFAFVMGQKSQLWWDLPPMESFLLNQKIYEVDDEKFQKTLDELVELLDVGHILDKQVRQLSLGERMKCELIAALLHEPKVLLLDEPTIGLDVVAQKNIRDFIKKYNEQRKTTIMLTSHYMEDIAQLCERIIIIDHGAVIYDGSIDQFINKYAGTKKITVYFEKEVERSDVERFGKLKSLNPLEAVFDVERQKMKEIASAIITSDLPVKDIDITEEDIESIIRNIFTKKQ